ncbi:MAG: DUF1573 domain-containing protein [Holophagales bacterium]|nr:DUF1573 domain-containing protein [Holophagales bacterium]
MPAVLALLLVLAGPPARSGPPPAPPAAIAPRLLPDEAHASFGESYQGSTVTHTFYLHNEGMKPVTIRRVETRSGGAGARFTTTPSTVPPGGAAALKVEQPLGDRLGKVTFRYRVTTDGPDDPPVRISLEGFVQSAYSPERLVVDLGSVDPRTGGSALVDLASDETGRLEIQKLETSSPELLVETVGRSGEADEGVSLRVRLGPGAPIGPYARRVRLTTNVANQPVLEGIVTGSVYGDVVPSPVPLSFGGGRPGAILAESFELRHRKGAGFRVVQLLDFTGGLAFGLGPCGAEGIPGCVRVNASFVSERPGTFGGELVVELEEGETLLVPWSATVFPEGTDLRVIGAPKETAW